MYYMTEIDPSVALPVKPTTAAVTVARGETASVGTGLSVVVGAGLRNYFFASKKCDFFQYGLTTVFTFCKPTVNVSYFINRPC